MRHLGWRFYDTMNVHEFQHLFSKRRKILRQEGKSFYGVIVTRKQSNKTGTIKKSAALGKERFGEVMRLPDCCDPVVQEERRQLSWDRWIQRFPVCDCCGRTLRGGEAFFVLDVRDDALTVCDECREQMEENLCFVEDML